MDSSKPKRKLTDWTSFCSKYYAENKGKFVNYKSMLQSQELKDAYKKSKSVDQPSGGKLKKAKKM